MTPRQLSSPLLFALACALVLGACSSGTSTGTGSARDGGTLLGADGGGGTLRPDGGTPARACASNADCDGGVCNTCARTCEATRGQACQEDVNCNVLEAYCDRCTGQCKAVAGLCGACADDRECGLDNQCLAFSGGARACGKDCSVGGCPVGYTCEAASGGARQCRPCAGRCNAPGSCSADADCPYRSFCNAQPGTCPACAAGCQDDTSCGAGQKCHDNGRCAGVCPAAPCPAGYTCAPDGHCTLPGGCRTNAECRDRPNAPNYCDTATNRCVPGCDEDNDCLPVAATQGTLCDRATRRCVQRPCTGTYQCAYKQFCSLDQGRCVDANGSYCARCNGDADCACAAGSTCPSGPNKCVEFSDADGGTIGKFCMVGGCRLLDGGSGESGCPQGFRCTELQDSGGTRFNACFRACWSGM